METIKHKSYTIKIERDFDPVNPRKDWDKLSTFAFFHRNYENESDIHSNDYTSWDEMRKHIEKKLDAICVPVYLYSHSGDTIRTTPFSCPWDSGQLGFAYITKEKARKWFDWKLITSKRRERIIKALTSEVAEYDQYIRGEIYGYEITKDDEEIESCWGFYGYDYCLEEAKNAVA